MAEKYEIEVLKLPEVKTMTGLSRTSIYTVPGFPAPIKLTPRSSGWLKHEITDWIESRPRLNDGRASDA